LDLLIAAFLEVRIAHPLLPAAPKRVAAQSRRAFDWPGS
jgi:hypothetical protein